MATNDTFHIHQIYFKSDQLAGLDPAFLPYDNSGCPRPDEREFYVFRHEFARGSVAPNRFTGFVSWKFGEKTGLTGQQFLDFARANPGYDVYFVNPYPMEIFLGNVWQQGDHRHPGLLNLAQGLFNQTHLAVDLEKIPRSLRISAFCNFWVGNHRCWTEFLEFCRPVYETIRANADPEFRRQFESNADPFRTASYFSFLFERMFTTFLAARPKIRALAYPWTDAELAQKYSADGVAILRGVLDLEAAQTSDPEPLARNPVLKAALNLYLSASEESFTPFGFWCYRTLRRIAAKLPNKDRLTKTRPYRFLTNTYVRALLPKSAQTTLPPRNSRSPVASQAAPAPADASAPRSLPPDGRS